MLRKTLFAAATAGALVFGITAAAPPAEAQRHGMQGGHHHRHGGGADFYFGFPFLFGSPYYDRSYDYDWRPRSSWHCHWVKKKKHHMKRRWVKQCHGAYYGRYEPGWRY